jgi:hypothetical protein
MSWPAATLLAVGSNYVPTSTTEKPVGALTLTHTHTHTQREREEPQCYKHFQTKIVKYRGKSMPVQANCNTRRFQEVETPRFLDSRHMQMIRISALLIGRLYPLRKYSWYSFLL